MANVKDYAALLTIQQAQKNQPWTVPYSEGVQLAASPENDLQRGYDDKGVGALVPHILGSHCVLHAVKSLGKIAAVYEARDHNADLTDPSAPLWAGLRIEHKAEIRKMAADLLTAALRFANLEGFDLAEALCERVAEKNGGVSFGAIPQTVVFQNVDELGAALGVHRNAGEPDEAYRARLHDIACSMGGCP